MIGCERDGCKPLVLELLSNSRLPGRARARPAWLLAVAVLGVLALGLFSAALDERLALLDVPAEVRQAVYAERDKLAGIEAPPETDAQRPAVEQAVDEAFVQSFRAVMLTAAALALVSALCAALMIKPEVVDASLVLLIRQICFV